MSSTKSNVNPDHYKVAGRERQGEDVVHSVQKQRFAETEVKMKRSRGDAANPPNQKGKAVGRSGRGRKVR